MSPLEERHSHAILLSLLDQDCQRKTDLLQKISRSSSMNHRLDELEKADLVTIRRDTFDYNTKWVSLTQRGRDVAILLRYISSIMYDDDSPDAISSTVLSSDVLTADNKEAPRNPSVGRRYFSIDEKVRFIRNSISQFKAFAGRPLHLG